METKTSIEEKYSSTPGTTNGSGQLNTVSVVFDHFLPSKIRAYFGHFIILNTENTVWRSIKYFLSQKIGSIYLIKFSKNFEEKAMQLKTTGYHDFSTSSLEYFYIWNPPNSKKVRKLSLKSYNYTGMQWYATLSVASWLE